MQIGRLEYALTALQHAHRFEPRREQNLAVPRASFVAQKLQELLPLLNRQGNSAFFREEEFNAIVFFAAVAERADDAEAKIADGKFEAFKSFLNDFINFDLKRAEDDLRRQEIYDKMINWGLRFLELGAKEFNQSQAQENCLLSPEKQPILKLASPEIFTDYAAYKQSRTQEMIERSKWYLVNREKPLRDKIVGLQRRRQFLAESLNMGLMLTGIIPGFLFAVYGLTGTALLLSEGKFLDAVGCFFLCLLGSVFPPVAMGIASDLHEAQIAKFDQAINDASLASDLVVRRELQKKDYLANKESRQGFKIEIREKFGERPEQPQQEGVLRVYQEQKELPFEAAPQIRTSPGTCIDESKSKGETLVVFRNREQAKRDDQIAKFAAEKKAALAQEGGHFDYVPVHAFFKGLKASKQKSRNEANTLCHEYEKRRRAPK